MKKFLSLFLVITCLFIFTGCGKKEENNTVTITSDLGKGVITLSVPKNNEEAKYNFTTTKPEGLNRTGTVYLETDTAYFAFSTSYMTYHTALKYKDKYGDVTPTFEDYLKWIDDSDSGISLAGLEKFDLNGRKAIRYYRREGGAGSYTYFGYNYLIEGEDIYPNSRIELTVQYKETEYPKESKEFDEETLNIIKSLKLSTKE